MLLEFLKPVGEYKVGDITDKFSDGVGNVLITEGSARASTDLEQTRRLLLQDAERRHQEHLTETRALLQGNRTTTGPPTGGGQLNGALEANLVDGKGEPVYEQGKRHFSDVLRCIHAVGAKGAPREIVDYASNRLRHVYSDEKVEYKINAQTGKMDSVVTRHLEDGGIETITRTGTDSLGGGATYGFTVKPEWLGDLFRIAREREVFADACRNVPVTQGVELKYPALGQYSAPTTLNGIPQPAVFSGITLAYKNETAARVESDGTTEEIDFKIVDMTGATSYSRDYIVDNFIAMDAVITALFGEAMAWIEDWVTIRGNGLAQPQGYFNTPALIQGGGISGGATRSVANKIVAEDLGWMLAHLAGQCERSARFIAHRSTIPQLFILNNAAGTPVFQPNALIMQSQSLSIMGNGSSDGRTFATSGMLLGYPIFFTEKVPQLGLTGDITLVCPDQYGLARRSGIEIGVSEHFYFSTDKIAYRFKLRHDGKSLWRAPYQDASAITTGGAAWQVSPFISLAHL